MIVKPFVKDSPRIRTHHADETRQQITKLEAQRDEERKKHEAAVTINERLLSDNRIVEAQRDELLEALERAADAVEYACADDSCGSRVCCGVAEWKPHLPTCYIMSAIAKVKTS